MRKIKFRAWDKENEIMVFSDKRHHDYWFDIYEDGLFKCLVNCSYCDSFGDEYDSWEPLDNLMQYTGIKDKNGKEVYEGDILSYKHITYSDCSKTKIEEIEDESFIEIITYAPMASIVKPHSKNVKCFGYDNVNKECLILDLTSDEVEVIGNKFENPELLG